MTAIALRERAVVVTFHDSVWLATKRDSKATNSVLTTHDAKQGAGFFKSRLVSKAALELRHEVSHAARTYHNKTSSPWMNDGVRIVPATLLQEYLAQMRKYQQQAEAADRQFFAEYADHINEARKLRGKLFDEKDYPSLDVIKQKFAFRVDVMPLPNIEDWRCEGLTGKDFDALQRRATEQLAELQRGIVLDLYERLSKVVAHMQERLSASDAKFKNSLVGNVKEMVGLVAKLNVTGDAKLEALRKEVEQKLAKQDPEELREVAAKRSAVARDAEAILKKMSSYMGGKK